MSIAPTFKQIQAHVEEVRKKAQDARVIGIRATGRWAGADQPEAAARSYDIRQCDSPLAIRLALREPLDPGATRVLITGLDDNDLSDDIRCRLAKRRLIPLDPWGIVKSMFGAQAVDPRLTGSSRLAELLLETIAPANCPRVGGGFLDSDTVWSLLLRAVAGFPDERPDLVSILRWSTDESAVARFRSASTEFREGARRWLVDHAGPVVESVFRCIERRESAEIVPIGLALGVIHHRTTREKLQKAAGKFEERYLAGQTLSESDAERWSTAATEVVRLQIHDRSAKQALLERGDAILQVVEAGAYAYVSKTSPRGFDQLFERFGRTLSQLLEHKRLDFPESLRSLRFDEIGAHELAASERERITRMDMALRLLRRLASDGRGEAPMSFEEAARRHTHEGSYLDWARHDVARGDKVQALSEAYAKLADRVAALREQDAVHFARLLAEWSASEQRPQSIIPVEHVLERVVAPLSKHSPVLFIVLDGMSVAVCREVLASTVGHEWTTWNRKGEVGSIATGLSAIPSVTEATRTSLLCGGLRRGTSSDETAGFVGHPALASSQSRGSAPILFHKYRLSDSGDAGLAPEVREAIASEKRQVVGVVVNAIDDLLLKGDQIGHNWSTSPIPILPALLHEAKLCRRLVILTSDHGHIIERSTEYSPREGGERWRTDVGDPDDREVRLSGPRVVMPGAKSLIAPWSEHLRYGAKKFGYHGGANPQEMITPIVVLSLESSPRTDFGWEEAPADTPEWWDDQAVSVLAGGSRKRPTQPNLPMDLGQSPPPTARRATGSGAIEEKWLTRLFDSSLYKQQKKLSGRTPPSDDVIREILLEVDRRGGKLTMQTLSRATHAAPTRLRGTLVMMQRILNIDGYPVVRLETASDSVEFDRVLLIEQFGLEKRKK